MIFRQKQTNKADFAFGNDVNVNGFLALNDL